MAQTAAPLVECVMPWVPTRQWVVSVPIPLRSWMSLSRDLMAQVQTTIRTTIAQFYVNEAVKRGAERQKVQPGSVSLIQRFGSSINLHLHFHVVFLEGVDLDRSDQGLKPRFVKAEPPRDADSATVLRKSSHRVIRKLRRLGYLEAEVDVPVATGMIRYSTTSRSVPAPWRPRSSSASPLANVLARKCAALVQVVAMRANGLNSTDPAGPV